MTNLKIGDFVTHTYENRDSTYKDQYSVIIKIFDDLIAEYKVVAHYDE